mmetsp:Transcript_20757/g.62529  ORF Transcript_20757/g.62529 Transcript_20757/m.62529 type:complete len:187 (+) Transcript_20757:139-699(+)
MLISKKDRKDVYKYLFQEGVLFAEKDFNLPKHPEVDTVSNLVVIKLMQSFKSRELVTERFAWRHYYWFLTDEGIEYLREYLNIPSDVVPNTMKKSTRPLERGPQGGGDRPPRREGGGYGDRPPRREGGEGGGFGRGGGDRGGYRDGGAPREGGGFGRGRPAGDDKAGGSAPAGYQPSFGRGGGNAS